MCDDIIREKDFRASTYVGQKQLWACESCNGDGTFKDLIDKTWDKLMGQISFVNADETLILEGQQNENNG